MFAVGAGDSREANRYAVEAGKYVGEESLTKLLRAQAAQLSGDRAGAVAAFNEMLASDDTLTLGLRGLHVEARRAGQADAALDYARRANARRALALGGASRARRPRPTRRLGASARRRRGQPGSAADRQIDRNRWRAVLKTALAEKPSRARPQGRAGSAREALDLAPGLVPAAALTGKLTAASGDLRKAARLLEAAYRATPHPDLAAAYVSLRQGDSAADRLHPRDGAGPRRALRRRERADDRARRVGGAGLAGGAQGPCAAHSGRRRVRAADRPRLHPDGRDRRRRGR